MVLINAQTMPDQWRVDSTPATTTRHRIDCFSHIPEADAEGQGVCGSYVTADRFSSHSVPKIRYRRFLWGVGGTIKCVGGTIKCGYN